MPTNCTNLLQSDQLIAALTNGRESKITEVYNCLRNIFKRLLLKQLIKRSPGFPEVHLQEIVAEESFQDAFHILMRKVQDGSFIIKEGAGVIAYFSKILWYRHQNNMKLNYGRNMFSVMTDRLHPVAEMWADMPACNRPGGVMVVLGNAIAQLTGRCRDYMTWQYLDFATVQEIIDRTHDTPGTVRKNLSICKKRLVAIIEQMMGGKI